MPKQSATNKYIPNQVWPLFEHMLPSSWVGEWLARVPRRFYQRLYPPLVVIWGFIFQRLNSDHTCDAYVSYLNSQMVAGESAMLSSKKKMSENTAAYCKARQRLPIELASASLGHTAQVAHLASGELAEWHGQRVCFVDGSTLQLEAEPELIAHYGQPKGRRGQSHWPVMRLVVAFDLFSGTLEAVEEGPYAAQEYPLAIQLLRGLTFPAIFVGDQLYGIYHFLQVIQACQHQAIFRIQARHVSRWTKTPLSSGSDLAVEWGPSANDKTEPDLGCPLIPGRLIYERVEQPGFRPFDVYLFTTLTDHQLFLREEILKLYAQRWQVEIDLRHVKTTLEMKALAAKSLNMVRKELILGLVAYNLIRCLISQAAQRTGQSSLHLSLAGCWRRIAETSRYFQAGLSSQELQQVLFSLLDRLGTCILPKRKLPRFEPRAIWGSPQPYPYMKGSRNEARLAWNKQLQKS